MGSKKKNRNGNNGGAASPSNENESPRPEAETPPPASPTDSAAPAVADAAAPAATTNAPQDDAPVAASAPADVAPAAEPTVAEAHEAPASAVDVKSEAPEASAAEPQTTADVGVTPHVESQPTQPPAEENTRTAANEPEDERRGARDEDAAAAVDAQPQTAPVSDATTQPQSEPANVDAHAEPVLQESDAPQAADPSSASEAAAPTTTEAAAVDATEPAVTVATADDKATPKRKRSGSKKRAGSKTPRSASKTPGTAKKTTGSASKTAKTPRSASKGKVGTPKKALAVAAAHIPKRALSFGRDRSVAEAPSPQAADTPTRPAEDAAASPVQDAASPQPVARSDSALFGNSVNMSASFSRKPVLRLYGEAAEHATDAKVRGPALRNVGWIYATGATDTVVNLDKAYAYFYHAAKDGDDGARFYMAQLQLGRKLSPDMLPWDPKSVGTDEAMSARRSRGRSASPRRGASPARGKSPGKASPARSRRAATGPFGGLKKAIENLELCAAGGSAEAMLELGYLHDPNMPAPVGYIEPAVDVAPTPTEKSSASLAKPAAADGAEAPPPILVRNEAVARVWYTKASELGNRTAAMRLEDLDEVAALLAAKQRRAGKAFTRDAGSSVAAAA